MTTRAIRFTIVVAGLILFLAGPSFVRLYTDWLWFGELGYQSVLATMLRSQGTLFTIVFAGMVVWLTLNLRIAVGSLSDARPTYTTPEGFNISLPGRRQFLTITNAGAMLVALLAGLYAASEWNVWMAWRHGVSFGRPDPLLGRDVAFYIFTLPFLEFVRSLFQLAIVTAAIASGAIYFLSGSLVSTFPARVAFSSTARRHLALLGAAFLLVLAFGAWLRHAEYLIPGAAGSGGATYTDVHARMPAALLLIGVSAIGAILALVQAFTDRRWPIPLAIGLYLVVSIGGGIYASLLQRIVVSPNEQARETPYIQHNIEATRTAFALDGIEERPISGEARLTRADIDRNTATLQNVRLWDHGPLLDTFSQLQEIRTYYDFVAIDNDRYIIDGSLRQVMLSGREINTTSLPNRTWVNERLNYTHGYGLTLGPVNQVTSQGLPVLFIRDMPPVTTAGLQVTEPGIYFGELSNDYVIVGGAVREFHFPREDGDESTQYAGRGGVPIGSFLRKVLFTLRFASYDIILSDAVTSESRIIFNRRISDRVQRLAGDFLQFDRDPYLVLVDGRLHWIYDAYTTSSRYPYSTRIGTTTPINYIRNSVKIVIDAYDGTTTAYLADDRDPVAATYARIFPGFFKPMSDMPAGIRAHVRYPEDMFAIQSQVYATYHMTDAATFYKREDQWEIPVIEETAQGSGAAMQPYYTIMRLPGEEDAEFIQMLPFTPRRKDNLAAWLVARSDGEHYGRLRVFEFPKQSLIFGPKQIVGRISQDQTIAPQITLWNQQGSQVIWGTMMVIPIEESLIYVRPLYLRAQGGRIPELTRVIVAYEDRIVMEPTLEASIARLFGGVVPPSSPPESDLTRTTTAPAPGTPPTAAAATPTADVRTLTVEARAHYDRAIAAQRAGDWAKYGEEIKALGEVLERMKR
jgi:hypothetical protein